MEVYNLKSKKTLILFFALAMVASACSSAAVPCDEVEITTGENGLPDLDGVHVDVGWGKTSGSGPRRHRYVVWVLSDLPPSQRTR